MSDNTQDAAKLLLELQIHQAELEMQNDELRIANEQLELQQLKFTGIYDLAPIGYFILDKSGVIKEVNNAGLALFETERNKILNHPLQNFVAPEHTAAYRRCYALMLHFDQKQSCQLKMITKNGMGFYVQMEGIAVNPSPALPLQFDIALMDITARVRAEQDLAKAKERLQLALKASAAVTWELEIDTMIFHLEDFNYQSQSITGGIFNDNYQTFLNLIYPEDREPVDQHFRKSLANQTAIDMVCRFMSTGNPACYASICGHVVKETGQPRRFVGIMMDITEKKKLEQEAAQLKHDQQKVVALATFNAEENERKRISDALHDGVSQLLYGIRIKLASLDEDKHSDMKRNINELLDLAIHETRNISFELAPSILMDFGLPAAIDELAKRLSTPEMLIRAHITGFGKRLERQTEISTFRIIQELVNNCMKHASASLITIEVKQNKRIEIAVKDNGKGYDTHYFKVAPSGSGLSSIKNRLSFYNGQLHITSQQGLGTEVNISLDCKPDHITPLADNS